MTPHAPGEWKVPSSFLTNHSGWCARSWEPQPVWLIGMSIKRRPPPSVDGVGEFPELLERSGALVEFGEGGVDVIKIERSKGAAITAHAGVGGGDGERGEEQDDAEAHFPDDVVEA